MDYQGKPALDVGAACWAAALLASLVVLSCAAPAAGSTERIFSPPSASFSLRASNGYRISVERFRRRVSLYAVHGGKSFFAGTSYTVPSKASAQRIDARFGRFGHVSVKLITERMHKGKLEEQCTGKPETTREGTFVGTIRFRGEGGYTSVDAQHAEGRQSSGVKIKCVFPNLRPGSGPVVHGSRQDPPSFGAFQGRQRFFGVEASGGRQRSMLFTAGYSERRGRMEIFRNAFAEAPPASFAFAGDLSSATVQPPLPFTGEASYQRGSASPWLGSLSVDFPGREEVQLAGPRFTARLARDSSGSSVFLLRSLRLSRDRAS